MALPVQYLGNQGFIGLAKEATFGTAVAASEYVKFISETLKTNSGDTPVKAIAGLRAANTVRVLTEQKSAGNIAVPFGPAAGLRLLGACLGHDSITGSSPSSANTVASGGAAGASTVTLTSASGYTTGLFFQVDHAASGNSEVHKILSVSTNTITLAAGETFLESCAAADVTHVVTSPFVHTLTPNESGIPSLTIEKALSTLESIQYAGCIVDKAQFRLATNAEVQCTFDVMAQKQAQITPTTASYLTETPYALKDLTTTIFGSGDTLAAALEFDINNGAKDEYTFTGHNYPTLIYGGERTITGKVTKLLQAMTDYTNAMAGTAGALVATMSQGASASAVFTMPAIVWGEPSQPLVAGRHIIQELPFTAYYLSGQTYDIQVVVTNTVWTPYI